MNSKLIETLKNNPPVSAIELIKTVQLYVKDDDNLISIIESIAAGADGISGTDDDIISPDVLDTLKMLLKHRVVHELAKEFMRKSPPCICFN